MKHGFHHDRKMVIEPSSSSGRTRSEGLSVWGKSLRWLRRASGANRTSRRVLEISEDRPSSRRIVGFPSFCPIHRSDGFDRLAGMGWSFNGSGRGCRKASVTTLGELHRRLHRRSDRSRTRHDYDLQQWSRGLLISSSRESCSRISPGTGRLAIVVQERVGGTRPAFIWTRQQFSVPRCGTLIQINPSET